MLVLLECDSVFWVPSLQSMKRIASIGQMWVLQSNIRFADNRRSNIWFDRYHRYRRISHVVDRMHHWETENRFESSIQSDRANMNQCDWLCNPIMLESVLCWQSRFYPPKIFHLINRSQFRGSFYCDFERSGRECVPLNAWVEDIGWMKLIWDREFRDWVQDDAELSAHSFDQSINRSTDKRSTNGRMIIERTIDIISAYLRSMLDRCSSTICAILFVSEWDSQLKRTKE
jgi:hypothetical protein